MKKPLLLLFALLFWGMGNAQVSRTVDKWLEISPQSISLPAFDSCPNIYGKTFDQKALLSFDYWDIENMQPRVGRKLQSASKIPVMWTARPTVDGLWYASEQQSSDPQISLLSGYLFLSSFQKVTIKGTTFYPFELYIDGKKVGEKLSWEKDSATAGSLEKSFDLETGKHLVLVKLFYPAEAKEKRSFALSYSVDSSAIDQQRWNLSPKERMGMKHYLGGTQVGSPKLSFDGSYYALTFWEINEPNGKGRIWTEIRKIDNNSLMQTLRGVSEVQFAPHANWISYLQSNDTKKTLLLYDFEKKEERILWDAIEKAQGFSWSPDGEYLLFYRSDEAPKNTTGVEKLEGMHDRWPGFRNRSQLYKLDLASGHIQPMTHGARSCSLEDIHPKGEEILFSTSTYNFGERPFTRQQLYRQSRQGGQAQLVWDANFGGSVRYMPDGKTLLVMGSADMFKGVGANVGRKKIVNTYDIQAFLYSLESQEVIPFTRNFDPSVDDAWPDAKGENIYLRVSEKDGNALYQYSITQKSFKKLNLSCEVLSSMTYSPQGNKILYVGSSIDRPSEAFLLDLSQTESQRVAAPREELYADVVMGKSEKWTFKNKTGEEIDGVFYYPPNFERDKKYPLIVYYYGGTSPTPRSLEMRYPKHLWAGHGYIVYVLQPSGAIGYGQEFSAAHVNNWGITVADEIIQGVKQFCSEHPFVDAKRIGCIGASYGGFMTQYLQTRTDLFAAAISHAGISSISSYWGEGFWGYLYSSAASANSYPWNNPKLYVEQSPLFLADKIHTPLLLLHGTADVNVPVGESYQLYTALKLLGRPVEMIRIEGEDHGIVDYNKRKLWEKSIIAWFDKYLKDQPLWWNTLYPPNQY